MRVFAFITGIQKNLCLLKFSVWAYLFVFAVTVVQRQVRDVGTEGSK